MNIDYHKLPSAHLGHDFEFKVYGNRGKPMMVFPCSQGRFYEYEDFGMIDLLQGYIEAGDICIITVDSRDSRSWYRPDKNSRMGIWQRRYELCITDEVVPFLKQNYHLDECYLATGNSWGAYHALNFSLKFPGVFDSAICLSGSYSLGHIVGRYYDQSVYYNDILRYLPQLSDPEKLEKLYRSYIIICHGTGAWEVCNDEARAAAKLLAQKGITCWYDVWGPEYPHDWPSWKQQIVKFLDALKAGVISPATPAGVASFVGPYRVHHPLVQNGHVRLPKLTFLSTAGDSA